MKTNTKLVALAGVALALFGYASSALRDRQHAKPAASSSASPERARRASVLSVARRRASSPDARPPVDMRKQIADAVEEEALPEVRAQNIPAYLDELERRAREQGEVTALHVEPGLQALAAAGAPPEEQIAFARRMEELSKSLRDDEPEAEVDVDVDEELDRIESASDPDHRAKLVAVFLADSQKLPPLEHAEALARLDRIAGAEATPMPSLTP